MLACCCCSLDAQAPPQWSNNLTNRLKYYALQLGDPNPNPHLDEQQVLLTVLEVDLELVRLGPQLLLLLLLFLPQQPLQLLQRLLAAIDEGLQRLQLLQLGLVLPCRGLGIGRG